MIKSLDQQSKLFTVNTLKMSKMFQVLNYNHDQTQVSKMYTRKSINSCSEV